MMQDQGPKLWDYAASEYLSVLAINDWVRGNNTYEASVKDGIVKFSNGGETDEAFDAQYVIF